MDWFFALIKQLISDKFTGKLEVNFSNGGIGNVNKTEKLEAPNQK
jgi:hypothetical protein